MTGAVLHENKNFENIDYAGKRLENREFVKCEFIQCDFSKSDLRTNDFVNCQFTNCNFTMTMVDGVGFRDVSFYGSKLLGVDFTRCNKFMFSFSFKKSILDYTTFFGMKLKKTTFEDCSLKEVDFSECDLSEAIFENCDLHMATFLNTNLEKADFTTSMNFGIDPDANKVKKAKFSALNLAGLLYKYNLHIIYDESN